MGRRKARGEPIPGDLVASPSPPDSPSRTLEFRGSTESAIGLPTGMIRGPAQGFGTEALKSRNRFAPANIRFHLFRVTVLPLLPRAAPARVPPVVIGAMGGSGTRVLPPILRLADYWMGAWVNPRTQDALATRYFLQRYFSRLAYRQSAADDEMIGTFSRVIEAHRWGIPHPDGRWGWKNPRSMWIIPFLSRVYPDMKFIHVVRDGRDMALSNNLNFLYKHGRFLLKDLDCRKNHAASQLRLWTLGNHIAHGDGIKHLGSNYLLLNYEELCLHPRKTLTRLFDHLGVCAHEGIIESARRLIVPSPNIGRWRNTDSALLHEPDEQTREALRLFGYETD